MRPRRTKAHPAGPEGPGRPSGRSALPGRGGLSRIVAAARNSARGLLVGARTEAAIRQELAVMALAVPVSFFVARDLWVWVALIATLLFVLAVEFLNTAIERLCDHVTPQRHENIKVAKDLASAGVTFSLFVAGLVWFAAIADRLGLVI